MREPLIPIDPHRTLSLADLDGIRDWGDQYEEMLDRDYTYQPRDRKAVRSRENQKVCARTQVSDRGER